MLSKKYVAYNTHVFKIIFFRTDYQTKLFRLVQLQLQEMAMSSPGFHSCEPGSVPDQPFVCGYRTVRCKSTGSNHTTNQYFVQKWKPSHRSMQMVVREHSAQSYSTVGTELQSKIFCQILIWAKKSKIKISRIEMCIPKFQIRQITCNTFRDMFDKLKYARSMIKKLKDGTVNPGRETNT